MLIHSVLRVLRSDGPTFEEITRHPDSGAQIVGMVVPYWPDIVRLAIEAARVLEEMPLVGWDIAPVESGPVLVELNETPDFKLHQLADRRGMLDVEFKSFLVARDRKPAA